MLITSLQLFTSSITFCVVRLKPLFEATIAYSVEASACAPVAFTCRPPPPARASGRGPECELFALFSLPVNWPEFGCDIFSGWNPKAVPGVKIFIPWAWIYAFCSFCAQFIGTQSVVLVVLNV